MLKDVIGHSQSYMDKVIAKKKQEQEEKLRIEKEKEEQRLKREAEKEAEEKQRSEEQKSSTQAQAQKKVAVVSKSKPVKHAKRKNVVKMAAPKLDLAKISKEKSYKEQEKLMKQKSAVGVNEETKEEDSSNQEDQVKVAEEKVESEKIKYLELPKAEETEIKNKIYNKVYEDFLQFYQGNQDRVKPLCLLLNIQFNAEDPNESLRAIFKRVKQKLQTLIDFDGDMALRETMTIEELNLESPYQEIRKDVQQRIMFLFELKPSMDYHSKVVKMDAK